MIKFSSMALLAFFSVGVHAQVKDLAWSVKKIEWSASDEKSFQEFVRGIGRAKEKRLCSTTENCIKNKDANPMFVNRNPQGLSIFSDCADLPHVLRGYFAWMNDLPFSFPTGVGKASSQETKPDIRYSTYGNKIISRRSVKTGDNVNTIVKLIANSINSAMFRVPTKFDVDNNNVFNDFYPIKISRTSLTPGTVFYDPNGHVLVVYDVAEDGRVFMIDAHPDNSLTRQVYDEKKFIVSSPNYGAGFKKWRPVSVAGGVTTPVRNNMIPDFSEIEYYGNGGGVTDANWKQRKFIFNGETITFGEYVRRSLASGNLKYHPVVEVQEALASLCDDFRDRAKAVSDAVTSGVSKKPHPVKLPENIYGTHGEWESYSTPSRDARFKASMLSLKEMVETLLMKFRNRDPMIDYTGNDLIGEIRKAYVERSTACTVAYTNSKGAPVTLNLDQVISRAFQLSFDPYHCPELRWGATGNELASCTDDANKRSWYTAQQNLRNAIDRNYDIRMDKTLQELPGSGLGADKAAQVSLRPIILAQ